MDEQTKQGKRSIDEIIEHMTADVQNNDGQYIPLGLTPPQTPVSAPHVWSEYASMSTSNSGPVHTYIPHPQIITNTGDNPMFFTDFSHYEVDLSSHLSKQNEMTQQNFYYPPQQQQLGMLAENQEVIRTVMDVGGGNLVNVVYGGRSENPGSIIPQAFHMVPHEASRETLPHTLGGFVPYHQPGIVDNSSSNSMKEYGLFRGSEMQQRQQIQQHAQQKQSQQQLQQLQHQLQQQQQSQQQLQQQQSQERQMQSSHFQTVSSNNQTQLIENLVGNWVPNQSGTYSPFGCSEPGVKPVPATNQQTTQTVAEHLEGDGEGKGMGRSARKTRIIAEVRPMRPSYSDVLTKSAPSSNPTSHNTTASKQNTNNQTAGSNKAGDNGKNKNAAGSKVANKKSKNGLLKRQHSSGSDEHNGSPWSAAGTKIQPSPAPSRKSVGGGEARPSSGTGSGPLPRKWASLDGLDGDPGPGSKLAARAQGLETDSPPPAPHSTSARASETDGTASGKKTVGVASPRMKVTAPPEERWDGAGATLNNHKPAPLGSGGRVGGGISATKRPIHINNNLGTSAWGGASPAGGSGGGGAIGGPAGTAGPGVSSGSAQNTGQAAEKNVVKGGAKPCKPTVDDKKANSAPAAGPKGSSVGAAGTGRAGPSRSSSGPGGGQAGSSGTADKPPQGKRGQRSKKKDSQSPILVACRPVGLQLQRWGRLGLLVLLWFLHLLSDVLGMSSRLLAHLCVFSWEWLRVWWGRLVRRAVGLGLGVRLLDWLGLVPHGRRRWWHFWRRGNTASGPSSAGSSSSGSSGGAEHRGTGSGADTGPSPRFKEGFPPGLEANIPLPSTGEEAMKRLLACKGKDPYSILGVTPHSSDDDIKKYYKRQAFLVHPDKNSQPGAEEAFKILVHAFELIGEPERRKAYDHRVAETQQVEQAWSELSDLLSQLHQKMEYAANTIRCTNCGKRHRRISVDRPCYAARLCGQCKIHHAAREGDIWAESSMLGFLWHYYACMDGAVYDITEWAACQADNLRHLRANTHSVQYRIVLGRQSQAGGHQAPGASHHHHHHHHHHHRRSGGAGGQPGATGHRRSAAAGASREPDLEDFLNNLYSQSGGAAGSGDSAGRADQARHRRKTKRKK